MDNDEFRQALFTRAVNEGETYHDPAWAALVAFAKFCARRRADEEETFGMERERLEAELEAYWGMNRRLGVYIGEQRGTYEEESGAKVVIGFVSPGEGRDVSHWQNGPGLYSKGWAALNTKSDFSHFGYWVNPGLRQIFAFVEGDTYLAWCPCQGSFFAECEYLAEHFGCALPEGCAKEGVERG